MSPKQVEIICPACGQEAFLLRQPYYEGFTKVGERLNCSACGHEFEDEQEVVFKEQARAPKVFSAADRPEKVAVFDGQEAKICRRCAYYVVNPFTEWCSEHKRETTATDTCGQYRRAADEAPGGGGVLG